MDSLFGRTPEGAFPFLENSTVMRVEVGDRLLVTTLKQYDFPLYLKASQILEACKIKQGEIHFQIHPIFICFDHPIYSPSSYRSIRRVLANKIAIKFREVGTRIIEDIDLSRAISIEDATVSLRENFPILNVVSDRDTEVISVLDQENYENVALPEEWEGYKVRMGRLSLL